MSSKKTLRGVTMRVWKVARLADELAGVLADGEDSEQEGSSKRNKRFSKYKNPTVEQARYMRRRESR